MSLTSLSLLPLLADVAVEAEVVRDEVEAVDPVRAEKIFEMRMRKYLR